MSPLEVLFWFLLGGAALAGVIVLLMLLVLGIEVAMALWERFNR